MFFISKIPKKKLFFSLYSQKQVFENRKQKLLPNITLFNLKTQRKWNKFIKLNACFHWILTIRNWKQPFACFQFPSQIEFWKQFLFSFHFGLPNKFFSFKNRKLFLKTKNKEKKTITKHTLSFLGPVIS